MRFAAHHHGDHSAVEHDRQRVPQDPDLRRGRECHQRIARERFGGDETARDIHHHRRGAGSGPNLRNRPHAPLFAIAHPQHQIAKGEVRHELPVVSERAQMGKFTG